MNKYVSKYTNMKQVHSYYNKKIFFLLDKKYNFGSLCTPDERNAVRCVHNISIKMKLSQASCWCLLTLAMVTHSSPLRF